MFFICGIRNVYKRNYYHPKNDFVKAEKCNRPGNYNGEITVYRTNNLDNSSKYLEYWIDDTVHIQTVVPEKREECINVLQSEKWYTKFFTGSAITASITSGILYLYNPSLALGLLFGGSVLTSLLGIKRIRDYNYELNQWKLIDHCGIRRSISDMRYNDIYVFDYRGKYLNIEEAEQKWQSDINKCYKKLGFITDDNKKFEFVMELLKDSPLMEKYYKYYSRENIDERIEEYHTLLEELQQFKDEYEKDIQFVSSAKNDRIENIGNTYDKISDINNSGRHINNITVDNKIDRTINNVAHDILDIGISTMKTEHCVSEASSYERKLVEKEFNYKKRVVNMYYPKFKDCYEKCIRDLKIEK